MPMPKWKVFITLGVWIPLGFLAGFSAWSIHKGAESIRERVYDFGYAVGPKGRIDYRRSIHFEGGEAVRVGAGMMALGACGLAWLAILCWPGPADGMLHIPPGAAKAAFALYALAVFALMPPWRLTLAPILLFYTIHGVCFACAALLRSVRNEARFARLLLMSALLAMATGPFITITAGRSLGRDAGHDLGFTVGVAWLSFFAVVAQAALCDRRRVWSL